MVKKILYMILLLLLLNFNIVKVNAHNFDNTQKIYDYATVLTDEEILELKNEAREYINKYNIDIVLVTVRYYTYSDLNSYTEDFYHKNNFGLGYNKNGIILVLDVKNNKSNIKLNGNVDLYSNIEIRDMLNKINAKSDYYEKLKTFINLSNEYALEDTILKNSSSSLDFIKSIIYSALIALIISLIVASVLIYKIKLNKNSTSLYSNIVSVSINKEQDEFITTNTKQINR